MIARDLPRGQCPVCLGIGRRTRTEHTCMALQRCEKLDGAVHDPNEHVDHYVCSSEHHWLVRYWPKCGCGWSNQPTPARLYCGTPKAPRLPE